MHQIMTDKGYPDLATWVALAMVPMKKMQKKKKSKFTSSNNRPSIFKVEEGNLTQDHIHNAIN